MQFSKDSFGHSIAGCLLPTITFTSPAMSKLLAFSAAVLLATSSFAGQKDQYSYRDFVKYRNTSKADTELHAFLQGIAYTIRNEYVCDDKDTENLGNPVAIVDELLRFANTDWGKFYLEYEGGYGVLRNPMTVGDVMLKFYTQHSRCKRLARTKEQFAR